MDKVELYRHVFTTFRTLCAEGKQPSSFSAYCRAHGVERCQMAQVLKREYQPIRTLSGYSRPCDIYRAIYEDFKNLCAEGRQPGTFKSYYMKYGIGPRRMEGFQRRNGLRLAELTGYRGTSRTGSGRSQEEIPFEEVIFEEAGFLPADTGSVITVKVDGHMAVSFPAGTDVAVIAKFIRKMGKEGVHVGA